MLSEPIPVEPRSDATPEERDDGLGKVRLGLSSIAEVTRVTGSGAARLEG